MREVGEVDSDVLRELTIQAPRDGRATAVALRIKKRQPILVDFVQWESLDVLVKECVDVRLLWLQ